MDFDLTEDQQAIESALDQIVERHRELPVGSAAYVQTSGALERDLESAGFMDIARQDGLGALEAVLLIDAVARTPFAAEVAASALVVPMLTSEVLPGPIVLARAPLGRPLRFLGDRGTALIDSGEDVRVVDLASATTRPAASFYNYPFGRFQDFDLSSARVLAGADPEVFRQYWRLGLAAEIVGAMDSAIALTTDHVKTRKQFGRPLGAFQAIQHRLSECTVMLNAARMLVREAAWAATPEAAALAAAYAQEGAARVIYDTHQFHGALGLTLEYPLHYWTYRLRVLQGELDGPLAQGQAAADLRWPMNRPIGDPLDSQPSA